MLCFIGYNYLFSKKELSTPSKRSLPFPLTMVSRGIFASHQAKIGSGSGKEGRHPELTIPANDLEI